MCICFLQTWDLRGPHQYCAAQAGHWPAQCSAMDAGSSGSIFFSQTMRCMPEAWHIPPTNRCANATPASNRPGLCGETDDDPGNCADDSRGSWRIRRHPDRSKGEVRDLADCIAKCCSCQRCNYVSFSTAPEHMECSWYESCDKLEPSPPTGDYVSCGDPSSYPA